MVRASLDIVEQVLRLWQAGQSASGIALKLRLKSRACAIGIIYRARMRGDHRATRRCNARASKKAASKTEKPFVRKHAMVRPLLPRDSRPSLAELAELQRVLKAADIPPARLIPTLLLQPHHCRAVYGEPSKPTTYGHCGRPRVPGTSWCRDHLRRYVPGLALQKQIILSVEEDEKELEEA